MIAIASPARAERNSIVDRDVYKMLRDEMQQALLFDPSRKVRTPAWLPRHAEMSAADVVYDTFSDRNGDARLHELLSILGAVARGEDMLLQANLWLSVASAKYAAVQVEMMDEVMG